MSHSEIGPVDHSACMSYRAGHHVHWIQAKKSMEQGQLEIDDVTIVVNADGRINLQADGLDEPMWNHDPARLQCAWERWGRAVWKPRFHILSMPGLVGHVFNLAGAHDLSRCIHAQDPASPWL